METGDQRDRIQSASGRLAFLMGRFVDAQGPHPQRRIDVWRRALYLPSQPEGPEIFKGADQRFFDRYMKALEIERSARDEGSTLIRAGVERRAHIKRALQRCSDLLSYEDLEMTFQDRHRYHQHWVEDLWSINDDPQISDPTQHIAVSERIRQLRQRLTMVIEWTEELDDNSVSDLVALVRLKVLEAMAVLERYHLEGPRAVEDAVLAAAGAASQLEPNKSIRGVVSEAGALARDLVATTAAVALVRDAAFDVPRLVGPGIEVLRAIGSLPSTSDQKKIDEDG